MITFTHMYHTKYLLLLIALSFYLPTDAKVLYIGFSTNFPNQVNHFNKISDAVKMADMGDTLQISAGWYDNDIFAINKKLVILGQQAGAGFKSTKNRSNYETILTFSNQPEHMFLINAPGTFIDGIRFGDYSGKLLGGLYINSPNVTIRNCMIINSSSSGIFISGNAVNTIIENNYLIYSTLEAILCNAEKCQITQNYIKENEEFSGITTSNKAIIKGNLIEKPAESGIMLIGNPAFLSFVTANDVVEANPVSLVNFPEINEQNTEERLALETSKVTLKAQSFFDKTYTESIVSGDNFSIVRSFPLYIASGVSGLLRQNQSKTFHFCENKKFQIAPVNNIFLNP